MNGLLFSTKNSSYLLSRGGKYLDTCDSSNVDRYSGIVLDNIEGNYPFSLTTKKWKLSFNIFGGNLSIVILYNIIIDCIFILTRSPG